MWKIIWVHKLPAGSLCLLYVEPCIGKLPTWGSTRGYPPARKFTLWENFYRRNRLRWQSATLGFHYGSAGLNASHMRGHRKWPMYSLCSCIRGFGQWDNMTAHGLLMCCLFKYQRDAWVGREETQVGLKGVVFLSMDLINLHNILYQVGGADEMRWDDVWWVRFLSSSGDGFGTASTPQVSLLLVDCFHWTRESLLVGHH